MNEPIAAGVRNLRIKYPGDGPLIFKGLSLSIRRGEKVLFLGPSGCGKSTLLQVLGGLIPNSVELPMKADAVDLPAHAGYVFQDPDAQFCMPYADEEIAFVLENLRVPREDMPARIRACLEQVGLQLPEPHTPIQQFSQGMKQRLAIAGMLALDPDVWLLDEPTALLDEDGTRQVWDTVRRVAADRTLIIVEHKIAGMLDLIDRVVIFSPDGEIVGDGEPDEMFRAHAQALEAFGIWYPGVWEAYDRRRMSQNAPPRPASPPTETGADPLLVLEDFRGLRGSEVKIRAGRLALRPGDWVAVTGPNGSGKSTLMYAIMRLIRTQGRCAVSGVTRETTERLAERIAFVFQNPEFQFVTNSVREELAYSLPRGFNRETLREMLTEYDLLPLEARHPYQLSTGQKRRLSVATALVRGQRVILLDEPTFGLDARSTFEMLERLERLRASGAAILMVTHDPAITRRHATAVWHVENGGVTEHALPAYGQNHLERKAGSGCN